MIKWIFRNNPALLGDLLEERASGRSTAWYTMQIAVAITRSIFAEVREHPVLTLRAVVVALGVYLAAAALAIFTYGYLYGYFLTPLREIDPDARWLLFPFELVPSAAAAWVVARTHRACIEAAFLVLIPLWILASMPLDLWTSAACLVGLLAGALVAIKRPLAQS